MSGASHNTLSLKCCALSKLIWELFLNYSSTDIYHTQLNYHQTTLQSTNKFQGGHEAKHKISSHFSI